MRTKDEILKELHKNRQPGMYGGIPPDTLASIQTETLIDIRDIFNRWPQPVDEINTMLDDGD